MNQLNWRLKLRGFRFFFVVILIVFASACTDQNIAPPIVLELRAMPSAITISDKSFYPKPFSIRAKYSDNTEKNISSRITWVSENIFLIKVNRKGEIVKTGDCLLNECVVSLIATDPESGKSVRLTVNISQKKDRLNENKNKEKISHEQNDVSEETSLEEKSPEINAEVNNDESAIANVVFSPMAAALDVLSEGTVFSEKSKKNDAFIRKLIFEENEVLLVSGDDYFPQIIAIDNLGQRNSNYDQSVVCYVTDNFTLSVVVLPGCQLIAGKPGVAEVEVKLLGESFSQVDTGRLNVRVVPQIINASLGGVSQNVSFSKNHITQWFQVSGLQTSAYYRVLMSGSLSLGYRLSVFTRSAGIYQACINEVPLGRNTVACYFQVLQNNVMFSVENLGQKAAQFSLNLEPAANELFLANDVLNSQAPVQLALGIPVSAFVFANKVGINNRHHYVIEKDDSLRRGVRVRLYGYSAQVKLSINWAGGFCNEKMLTYGNKDVVCLIPDYVSGKININIDGNNGEAGVLNGPAAAFGGTFYSLAVGLLD